MFASLKQKTCGKRDKHMVFSSILYCIYVVLCPESGSAELSRKSDSSRFRVSDFGCRVSGFGFRFSGFGLRVSDFGFLSSAPLALVCGCRLFKGCRPQRAGATG